jgi:hypothetical protein
LVRRQKRRNTLAKARKRAKEIADRLNKDGARAEFITEKDRRILLLSKQACKPLNLEVDEVCRRYANFSAGSRTAPRSRRSISKMTTASRFATAPRRTMCNKSIWYI